MTWRAPRFRTPQTFFLFFVIISFLFHQTFVLLSSFASNSFPTFFFSESYFWSFIQQQQCTATFFSAMLLVWRKGVSVFHQSSHAMKEERNHHTNSLHPFKHLTLFQPKEKKNGKRKDAEFRKNPTQPSTVPSCKGSLVLCYPAGQVARFHGAILIYINAISCRMPCRVGAHHTQSIPIINKYVTCHTSENWSNYKMLTSSRQRDIYIETKNPPTKTDTDFTIRRKEEKIKYDPQVIGSSGAKPVWIASLVLSFSISLEEISHRAGCSLARSCVIFSFCGCASYMQQRSEWQSVHITPGQSDN